MEIPRGFDAGRTAGVLNAAAGATPGALRAAAPYAALEHGISRGSREVQQFVDAAKADQFLQDKLEAEIAGGKIASAAKSVAQAVFEQRKIRLPDDTERDASDYIDPANPARGTFGDAEFRRQMEPIEKELYANMPKQQKRLAQLAGINAINAHAVQLQDALITRRGQDRVMNAQELIEGDVANGDYDGAVAHNKEKLAEGSIPAAVYTALDTYISKQRVSGKLLDFSADADSGSALADFADWVDALNDPNIDNDQKREAISSAVSLHNAAIVQADKQKVDRQHANAVDVMRGIVAGEITTDKQIADMELEAGQIASLSSYLHRDGEALDSKAFVEDFARALSDARAKSPTEQNAMSIDWGARLDVELEAGRLSAKTYAAAKEQLIKLNDPVFSDPYYREAVSRAAGFLGADVATMAPGATPDDIMKAVFNAQPRVSAALADFKFALDDVAMRTPAGQRTDLLNWTLDNIETYMQTAAGKAVTGSANIMAWVPDKVDADGNLKPGETRDSVDDAIHANDALSEAEQDRRIHALDAYLSYQERLRSVEKAKQQRDAKPSRLGNSG